MLTRIFWKYSRLGRPLMERPRLVLRVQSLRGAWLLFFLLWVMPAKAVLFYWTGDTNYNTRPPTGALTNSGWQYEGAWEGFSGTVISSNCFVSAKHLGGAVGDAFTFQGIDYTTVASYEDTNSDLRILRVSGQFPIHAPLYSKSHEAGSYFVVFGRGTQRGAAVQFNNRVRGWQWGAWDHVLRWGQSRVSTVVDGGAGVGQLLRAPFVAGAGRNAADLSGGDSGGAVFIKDGRFYKLAGINYGVDGPYNTTNSGAGFDAALFDQRGFYVQGMGGMWTLVPERTAIRPGAFYATRISSRLAWINSILSQSSP